MEKKDVFLESKIQTPASSRNFLIRERLIQRLNSAEERLMVVSAGMGYGKTVLLTHYAKRYLDKCAWYHLDATDNDIMVFVRYLCKTVGKVEPAFDVDFGPYLQLDQSEALVRNLAKDFAEAFRALGEREVCVVLDDFQVIENEWIFLFLNGMWDSDHGAMRMFLCTKSAPPAFCAKYLLEQKAQVLGADALAFNLEEIRILAADCTTPDQLDAVSRAIETHMEGWPAGVSFAILYFRQRRLPMTEADIEQACQQRYLRDYFMHELFRKLPFHLQQFLTFTSVLTYLRPDVCNALVGIDNAASQLSYLEQENLFILRLSGGGRIYRYHSMFRSFLLGQLLPRQRTELLEQASDFYLRTPEKAQAVEYAIACGDGNRLQSAVETAGPTVLAQGKLETLHRWLEELHRTRTPSTPEILLLSAQYCERVGQWQEALDVADRAAAQYPEHAGERCWLEAKLLWARVMRVQVSLSKSLAILEEIGGRLGPERAALRTLRRQAMELRVYDLLDLKQYAQAMSEVQAGMDACLRRGDERELAWLRGLCALCCFVTGEYRQAMRMCVVQQGGGGGTAAEFINLYLALSGHAQRACERLRRTVEEGPENGLYRPPETRLMRLLVERLAQMESGGGKQYSVKAAWDDGALYRQMTGQAFGETLAILQPALAGDAMDIERENALFTMDSGRLMTLQNGARWLTVRAERLRGNRERALELCRKVEQGQTGRDGFLTFLTLEKALLLWEIDRPSAESLVKECGPYLMENQLVYPGLNEDESTFFGEVLVSCKAPAQKPDIGTKATLAGVESPRLRVRCFGMLTALLPDGEEMRWRTRKAQELFAYLFHLNGAVADRERLMDLLWPQASPSNATSLLHTSLYSLRKALTPYGLDGLFQREKRGYRMEMSLVETEREQVDELLHGGGEPAQVPALYRGAYMEDVEAPWVEESRAWYADGILRVSRAWAESCMGRGDYRSAAECLRSAIRQEPYDEPLAGQLIQCYAAMGEMKNAIAQYNRLKDTLAEELEAEPGEEITHIYRECLLRRLNCGRTMG